MQTSTTRILTTHTGSLPRPPALLAQLIERQRGGGDAMRLEADADAAVADIVQKQVELGVDVVNDGEMSKFSYAL